MTFLSLRISNFILNEDYKINFTNGVIEKTTEFSLEEISWKHDKIVSECDVNNYL